LTLLEGYSGAQLESSLELSETLAKKDAEIKSLIESMEKMQPLLEFVEFTKKEELQAYVMELKSSKSTQKGVFVFSEKDPNVAKKVFGVSDSYLIKNPLRKRTAKNSE